MMAYPSMLVEAAIKAGMEVPLNPDERFDEIKFPHFHLFCETQLGRKIRWGEHWENAKVIASLPVDELNSVTIADLRSRGFEGL